jgi:hypothetical protein
LPAVEASRLHRRFLSGEAMNARPKLTYPISDVLEVRSHRDTASIARHRADDSHLKDLVEVLAEHSHGLRKWSVMRAMRTRRERAGLEISPKFEDEIERVFRSRCAPEPLPGAPERVKDSTLFYRPKERAGEVWAVFHDKAGLWLSGRLPSFDGA